MIRVQRPSASDEGNTPTSMQPSETKSLHGGLRLLAAGSALAPLPKVLLAAAALLLTATGLALLASVCWACHSRCLHRCLLGHAAACAQAHVSSDGR